MAKVICPGCGLELESQDESLDKNYNASGACRHLYDELSAFTLSLGDKDFIHQTVADAYAAQHVKPDMKPITVAFALIGLYLAFERGYTGRQVQKAHMELGKIRRAWPHFVLPVKKSPVTVFDVLQGLTAENYREKINNWGESVWMVWVPEHKNIADLVKTYLK